MKIEEIERNLNILSNHRSLLERQIAEKKKEVKRLKLLVEAQKNARDIIRKASQLTQSRMKVTVTDVVSSFLKAVPFKNKYEFQMEFVEKRNNVECELFFKRGDKIVSPTDGAGYGAADVASFALSSGYILLSEDVSKVLIADEPFANLNKANHMYVFEMIRELCKEFGFQIILSTHENSIIEGADNVIEVYMDKKGNSKIR